MKKPTKSILLYVMISIYAVGEPCLADYTTKRLGTREAEFKTDKASVQVSIDSSVYTYKVTNLQESPIVSFKINHRNSYAFTPPQGWTRESMPSTFYAETNEPDKSIGFEKTSEFTVRVSSRGAILGKTKLELRTKSGEIITIPAVWAPTAEPAGYPAAVAGTVIAILLFQVLIIRLRKKQKASIKEVKVQ